jgi:hypothetical protein
LNGEDAAERRPFAPDRRRKWQRKSSA